MTYSYEVYYRQNCIVPLVFILFAFVALIFTVFSIVKSRAQFTGKNILKNCITLGVLLFLITINGIRLVRGGVHLLWEKPHHAVRVSGEIERIIEMDSFTGGKYGTANNNGRGEGIVVNNKTYYLTTCGDYQVGDSVNLLVLPRSRFVLEMDGQGANSAPSNPQTLTP